MERERQLQKRYGELQDEIRRKQEAIESEQTDKTEEQFPQTPEIVVENSIDATASPEAVEVAQDI